MGLLELFLIAVGLSMDAFAVSVCKGLSVRTLKAKHAVICGLYFGGFQLLMPLIGFALGVRLSRALITGSPLCCWGLSAQTWCASRVSTMTKASAIRSAL